MPCLGDVEPVLAHPHRASLVERVVARPGDRRASSRGPHWTDLAEASWTYSRSRWKRNPFGAVYPGPPALMPRWYAGTTSVTGTGTALASGSFVTTTTSARYVPGDRPVESTSTARLVVPSTGTSPASGATVSHGASLKIGRPDSIR